MKTMNLFLLAFAFLTASAQMSCSTAQLSQLNDWNQYIASRAVACQSPGESGVIPECICAQDLFNTLIQAAPLAKACRPDIAQAVENNLEGLQSLCMGVTTFTKPAVTVNTTPQGLSTGSATSVPASTSLLISISTTPTSEPRSVAASQRSRMTASFSDLGGFAATTSSSRRTISSGTSVGQTTSTATPIPTTARSVARQLKACDLLALTAVLYTSWWLQ